MNNISIIKDCFGCGVCASICPKGIIDISLNDEGFYQPSISSQDLCVDCGLCLSVCAYNNEGLSLLNRQVHCFAAWSKDANVRKMCSSGGVSFELGRTLISQGYKVCAVRYNAQLKRAEHYIASTVEELIESVGSKYIQSYTLEGFKSINRKEKYFVTGTPCQIDSFRHLLKKLRIEDNFILLDFFCHGVPSMFLWYKYLNEVECKIGPVFYASWRNKATGWHDSWSISLDGNHLNKSSSLTNYVIDNKLCHYNSRLSEGDKFYKLFLGNACLGKACYNRCKYKYLNSSADIRIGDLWGNTYKKDEYGVSAVISFTEKGNELLSKTNCEFTQHSSEIVAEGQLRTCLTIPAFRDKIIKLLKSEKDLTYISLSYDFYLLPHKIFSIPRRALYKLVKLIRNE